MEHFGAPKPSTTPSKMPDFRVYPEKFSNLSRSPVGQKAFIAALIVGCGIHWMLFSNSYVRTSNFNTILAKWCARRSNY